MVFTFLLKLAVRTVEIRARAETIPSTSEVLGSASFDSLILKRKGIGEKS